MGKNFTKFIFISFLLSITVLKTYSQDITGIWEGNYSWAPFSVKPQKLVVEINLHNDSIITGLSHLYYRNGKYEHYSIKGIYRKKDSTFIFREDSALAIKLGWGLSKCLGIYKTKLRFTDSSMRQEGRWRDQEFLSCPSSKVWLEKKLNKTQLQPVKQDEPGTAVPVSEKKINRQTDIQNLVEISLADKDSIRIEVYDNGIVDDDTVSVYIDNKQIIDRQRITDKPLTFYISLDKSSPFTKLRLLAESLGSIPPCTALMIITTRHNRYEVNLSSNFNKNGAVELFLKE